MKLTSATAQSVLPGAGAETWCPHYAKRFGQPGGKPYHPAGGRAAHSVGRTL